MIFPRIRRGYQANRASNWRDEAVADIVDARIPASMAHSRIDGRIPASVVACRIGEVQLCRKSAAHTMNFGAGGTAPGATQRA